VLISIQIWTKNENTLLIGLLITQQLIIKRTSFKIWDYANQRNKMDYLMHLEVIRQNVYFDVIPPTVLLL